MASIAVIISHYESQNFLHAAIRQIRKYANPLIHQKIIVADQSCRRTMSELKEIYKDDTDIEIVWMKALYSGYGLDFVIKHVEIETDYIVQLHSDSFPISAAWLSLPIALIEENNFSFVGQLQFINGKDNLASIYPPNPFFAMAQCFNVARTSTYKEMSLKAGFTRFHNRPQSGLTFENNDWADWAADDYENKGSDDDVVAFHWEDKYKEVSKLGLSISGFCEPSWGRIIENLVFHFCSANESRGVFGSMPERYQYYTQKINENYSDEIISEMTSLAKLNTPPNMEILSRNFWNGTTKESTPTSELLNKRIEELKA